MKEMQEHDAWMGRLEDEWDWLVDRVRVAPTAHLQKEMARLQREKRRGKGNVLLGEGEGGDKKEEVVMGIEGDAPENGEILGGECDSEGQSEEAVKEQEFNQNGASKVDDVDWAKLFEQLEVRRRRTIQRSSRLPDKRRGGGNKEEGKTQEPWLEWGVKFQSLPAAGPHLIEMSEKVYFSKDRKTVDWASKSEIGYEESVLICMEDLGQSLTREALHWVAKGRAYWKIVKAEREMAEKEEKELGIKVARTVNPHYLERVGNWKKAWERNQRKGREERIETLEKRGLEGEAERLRRKKFKVRAPRRPGFVKGDFARTFWP